MNDLKFAFRQLLKDPGFTAVAVLTLALGIGANTAIFSVVNAVLLHPLPFGDPKRLVMVWNTFPQRGWDRTDVTPLNFLHYREQAEAFDGLAAFRGWNFTLIGGDEPANVSGARVSADFFSVLGVNPSLGRVFRSEESRPGRHTVALLAHSLWQRRFGSDPALIGETVILDGESYTVLGVMPPGFQFPKQVELWTPLVLQGDAATERGGELKVIARLKPGVNIEQAQLEMSTVARRLEQQFPETNAGWGVRLVSLREELVGNIGRALLVLFGAVSFVLLIACANVANLLLARATARQKEIAIRVALGAGQIRIIRQLCVESLLLAALGGVLGALLAVWAVPLIVAVIPPNVAQTLPALQSVGIKPLGLSFTTAVSLLTGMLCGLVPAWQSLNANANESLKEGGRSSSEGARRHHLRRVFVISEVAVALILLTGAGLTMKSFLRLIRVNPGFNPENALALEVALPKSKYPERHQQVAFFQDFSSK